MKVLIEQDNGKLVEVREIEGIGDASNLIIAFCRLYLKGEDRQQMEKELSDRTGKRWVILPPYIERVYGVR